VAQIVGGDGVGFDGHYCGGLTAHGEAEEASSGVGVEQGLPGSG
jgi:hypothetical protein